MKGFEYMENPPKKKLLVCKSDKPPTNKWLEYQGEWFAVVREDRIPDRLPEGIEIVFGYDHVTKLQIYKGILEVSYQEWEGHPIQTVEY